MISSDRSGSRLPVGSSASIELRIVDERARDRDALLLAARELLGIGVHPVLQPDPLEHLERLALLRRDGHAEHARHERDVLEDGLARDELEILEDEADDAAVACTCARRQRREVAAADLQLRPRSARPRAAAAAAASTCRRRSAR